MLNLNYNLYIIIYFVFFYRWFVEYVCELFVMDIGCKAIQIGHCLSHIIVCDRQCRVRVKRV